MTRVLPGILASLQMAFFMFWETLWPLVLGFGLSGAVQAFVSRSQMQRLMGNHGLRSVARASFFGMISSSCSYAASAMAKSLFQKGADFTTAMVFMLASTNLVVELGLVLWILIGWQFAAAEYVGGIVMIALLALVSRFFFTPRLVEEARERLNARPGPVTGHEHHGEATELEVSFRKRVRSAAGWADAASYTMADLTMLRSELVIGYVVAGFLAVIVPTSVWNVLFYHGHGVWTTLENVVVGPLIAVISFVCSIGNVPLAAALWTGGISFGGVVSFIFADLITMPLILIYRKLYGWALTWRLIVAFWIVMSLAGLVTELLFGAVGVIPQTRPLAPVVIGFQWNYTTYLNLASLVAFGVLYWLYRNRARFGSGAGYAIDPVCGMQVQTGLAPARTEHDGQPVYFCSDRCLERYAADPARFMKPGGEPKGMEKVMSAADAHHDHAGRDGETELDPVCGMTVVKASAPATRELGGMTYYFCMEGCAVAFSANPVKYLGASSAIDPVCEMSVSTADAAAHRTVAGERHYFCSTGCAEAFDADPSRYSRGGTSLPTLKG